MPTVGERMINQQLGNSAGEDILRPPGTSPTTGTGGQTQAAILAEFARRIQNLEGAMIHKVDGDRVLSMIALTKEAVLIQADQIGMLGPTTFADWYRDVSGQATGVVAPSITQIRGGVIRTERVQNFSGTAWVDLDATGTTDFIRSGTGVAIKANGTFTFGGTGNKALVWDGTNLAVQNSALLGTTPVSTVVANANFGATRSVGDITADVLSNSATSITMNSSQLFKSTGGVAGVFIGAGGITGKNALGQNTFAISGSTGEAFFAGDIETNGKGVFNGVVSSSVGTAAVVANSANGAQFGVLATSTNGAGAAFIGLGTNCPGVWGQSNGSSNNQPGVRGIAITGTGPGVEGVTNLDNRTGVLGRSSNNLGFGVRGLATASSGTGVVAENTGGGTALHVLGTMAINNTNLVSNFNASFLRGFSTDIVRYVGDSSASTNVVSSIILSTIGGGSVRVPVVA